MSETHAQAERRGLGANPVTERCARMAGIVACCIAMVAIAYFVFLYFVTSG
jgi:hypothetical protein